MPPHLCTAVPSPSYYPPPPLTLLPNSHSSFTSQMASEEPSLAPDSVSNRPCAISLIASALWAETSCPQNLVHLGAQASQGWACVLLTPQNKALHREGATSPLPTQAPQVPPEHAVHFHVWCPSAFAHAVSFLAALLSAIHDSETLTLCNQGPTIHLPPQRSPPPLPSPCLPPLCSHIWKLGSRPLPLRRQSPIPPEGLSGVLSIPLLFLPSRACPQALSYIVLL